MLRDFGGGQSMMNGRRDAFVADSSPSRFIFRTRNGPDMERCRGVRGSACLLGEHQLRGALCEPAGLRRALSRAIADGVTVGDTKAAALDLKRFELDVKARDAHQHSPLSNR